ncbi:MAG: DUF2027 domain-containing protein [Prolixibacteraceae bacterium]|jgi:hypothetical protein|nr:DUF2027 domain-containing protein [Prolixibacteraceae bacterium]
MLDIGDKVKFLNNIGGGRIVSFQSKNIAVVEGDDGFEIPVMITELVKVEEEVTYNNTPRSFGNSSDKNTEKQAKEEERVEEDYEPVLIPGNDQPRFYMAFYPTDQNNPVGGEIEIYFINDSNFSVLYHYVHFDGEKYQTIDADILEPNTKNYIDGLGSSDLNSLPKFYFRIIPFEKESKSLAVPISKEISVNSVKFYKEKSFTENDFFDGKAMIFDLVTNPLAEEIDKMTEKDFKKVINEKDKQNRPEEQTPKPVKQPDIVEVDLHIDELIDSTAGLSNREILDIQLDKFYREMDEAIKNRVKRIVFIHGVGNGVLKQEIGKKLKSKYARFNFQDASFKEYGYGATMVIFRRK